jgi:hypothetical protein
MRAYKLKAVSLFIRFIFAPTMPYMVHYIEKMANYGFA